MGGGQAGALLCLQFDPEVIGGYSVASMDRCVFAVLMRLAPYAKAVLVGFRGYACRSVEAGIHHAQKGVDRADWGYAYLWRRLVGYVFSDCESYNAGCDIG